MTCKFKWIVASLVALGSCKIPVAARTDPSHQLVQVIVVPESISLDPAQQMKFAAYGRTMSGDSSVVSVSWSATGGRITPDGTFAADTTPGDFVVSGTSTAPTLSASAWVRIRRRPVATVSVSPASANVTTGQTVQLTATPLDANGNALTGRVVTWGSSNTGVATVDGSGLVTGVAAGSVTITATSEGTIGTAAVTVTPMPVASVSVTPASVSVTMGQTVSLTAIPRDASGNALVGRVVTWASSNSGIATVSGSGLVTGVAAGSATITATSEGKNGTATVTVTPTAAPVASVSVSPATTNVTAGQTVQLTATPRDAGGNALVGRALTWTSSDAGLATVTGSGLVTGVATGSATITATSEGQSGTATVTVTPVPVSSVSVSPASASVTAGQTVQLTATPRDAGGNALTGRVVTWTTSNAGVATVSGGGLVMGVAAGSVTITATSEGKSGTVAITVTPVPVASVSVSPASSTVNTGQKVQLTATLSDASGNPLSGRVVTWASSNTPVATVNGSGLVTGVNAGSATITATSEGKSGTAAVSVTLAPVASVSVSPASASVTAGQSVQFTATPRDASGNALAGRVVTWASGNTAVATVNGSGLVTGVGAGSVTITATSEGVGGSAAVTVVPVAAGAAFPLHVEAGKHYLVDAHGNPFLMHGDAAWSLIAQLTREDAAAYLEDRRQKGFNTVIVNLIEHFFADHAPNDVYGDPPFLTPGDFTTPNEAYFAHADYVINLAAQKGMLVLLFPDYMGYSGTQEGWWNEMVANGPTKLATYGTYIAQRFRAYDNIIWVHGADFTPPDLTLVRPIPTAMRAVDPKWLHTFDGPRNTSALGLVGTGEPWLGVNTIYTDLDHVVGIANTEYARSTMPFFLNEAVYEGDISEDGVRQQAYQAVLSGATGEVMGNTGLWAFPSGWQQALQSRGAITLQHLPALLSSRAWWTMVPDVAHAVVTNASATTGRASDGSFALTYLPHAISVTANLSQLSGPNVTARWYDPANGTFKTISGSPFPASGTKSFASPGANSSGFNDWVLVLESAP